MKKFKICPSCSAEYDDTLPKCPYCDTLNYKGAEAEYLDKLEDMRSDMEDLGNIPEQETKKEFAKQGKFLKKVLFGIGLCVILLTVLMVWTNREQKIDAKAEYSWKQENFPIWDELYENQEYSTLVEMYWEAAKIGMPYWDWKHGDFCEWLDSMMYLEQLLDAEAKGEQLKESYYVDILYYQLRIEGAGLEGLSQEEKERLAPYMKPVTEDFKRRWNFTETEKDAISMEQKKNYGYVSYDFCEEFIKNRK